MVVDDKIETRRSRPTTGRNRRRILPAGSEGCVLQWLYGPFVPISSQTTINMKVSVIDVVLTLTANDGSCKLSIMRCVGYSLDIPIQQVSLIVKNHDENELGTVIFKPWEAY
jgi:hypothetical protein